MKKLVIGSLIAALASPVAQASNWKYLGEGTLNEAGTEFGYYVDSDSLQHLKALRGVWLKYDFHKLPIYVLENVSISCLKGTSVSISRVLYDINGQVMRYDGSFSGQASIQNSSILSVVKAHVCQDYSPSYQYAPYSQNIPSL